jgi:nitrilase
MTRIKVAAIQAESVWLNSGATTDKALSLISDTASQGVELAAFPETFLPGYPFWLSMTNASHFDDTAQKEAYAAYLEAAITVPGPEMDAIAAAAREHGIFLFLGIAERDGGSVYCSLAAISPDDGVVGVHRKLVPTYEERLVWAPGDGHGLRTHRVAGLRAGGLCCWENWMPQARHALYADGEELHVSIWPGSAQGTADAARFIALEGRVFSVAASGINTYSEVPADFPLRSQLRDAPASTHDGGSGIAGPDGAWLVAPVIGEECVLTAEVALASVHAARQNLDPAGHYSRPDVFRVSVDRERRRAASFTDGDSPVQAR